MAVKAALSFEQLSFTEEESEIKADFLGMFYFKIPKSDLQSIAEFRVKKNTITFTGIPEKKAQKQLGY